MPGNAFFLDSSYIIALAQVSDQHHAKALQLAVAVEQNITGLVTTRAVLLEIGSALSKIKTRRDAIRLINSLQSSSQLNIVPLTEEIASQGWNLFCQRPDKEWSWTDCISFVVMKERGLTGALTSDQHFEQGGFTALLRH
jgi:predicted nucleic acid-binding protein